MKRSLNTCYRLVWNAAHGVFMAVSELTTSHQKKSGVARVLVAATLTLGSGVQAAGTDILPPHPTDVPVGETIDSVVIKSGDTQNVYGQATNTTILGGGTQYVAPGGTADRTTISGADGQQFVTGTATNTTVSGQVSDDSEESDCGFQADCSDGPRYVISEQNVSGGGTATGTVLNAGGWQFLRGNSTAVDTIINANGYQEVNYDSTATGTVVGDRAAQGVISGGHAINTTLGVASDTPLKYGAYQVVLSAGSLAENTTINNGGVQQVAEGGQAVNSVVNNGGRLELLLKNTFYQNDVEVDSGTVVGGTAKGVNVAPGGLIYAGVGTTATEVVIQSGGKLQASTGATVMGTNSLGRFSIDAATGHASHVLLDKGGRLDVLENGTADNTTVNNGGILAVENGGQAYNTVMNAGGVLIADTHAIVSGTNALGAFSIDAASGQARGLWLDNGSRFTVKANGQAENTTIGYGGEMHVESGGSLSGTTRLAENAHLTLSGDVISTGTIENAGAITFSPEQGNTVKTRALATSADKDFTPRTLTTTALVGQGGTMNMNIRLDTPDFPTDRLVIDGGQATGKTWLNFTNIGGAGLGLATTGNGINVVEAMNNATTARDAFALSRPLQAGAYNYTLNHGTTDENWYLSSEAGYRAEVALYASLFAQSMDYDRALAGSYHQRSATQGDSRVWGRIQGGHIGHGDNGGIAKGNTPESDGSYGFVQLGGDLLSVSSMRAGIYAAAGQSSVNVKNDDHARAGTVRDDVYSLGGYLTAVHADSGLWADMVAQGSRHSLKANSDDNRFSTTGTGWLASLETGLPFNVSPNLVLEPQLQYTWQGLSLDNGHDNGGYVKFGDGSAQHVRVGIRFGSSSEMDFGQGSSAVAGFADSMKRSASELPVNGWVRPSIIRTFSSDGTLNMGTATAGSNMAFTPSQDGTSLDLQAGVEALVRQNVTLGVQGGYTRNLSGNSADGYNGQATLKVSF